MPEDPNILLSYINLKLRDRYSSLEDLCEDLDVSSAQVEAKLEEIGRRYDREINQFVSR